ncbi:MAG TPA: NIPSNAP family protein [Verrucomicrobiae bacterium]
MKRRHFLSSSALAAGFAATLPSALTAVGQSPAESKEFYELRRYHLRRGPMQQRFDDYFRDLAIPALNRRGVSPVGVFDVTTGPDSPTKYVLQTYKSLDIFFAAHQPTGANLEMEKAEFLNLPPGDPPYIRVESSFMVAFDGMPKLEVPKQALEKKPRLFELRTYESHSEKASRKKIEMFNTGEIALFRRTGLTPVFFGETLVGARLPNLTYLLVFDDMPAHDANWRIFVNDPEWKKMSSAPGFTDPEIVTNISNVFLRPTAYSQV